MELLTRTALIVLVCGAAAAQSPRAIVHSRFQDFAKGTLGDAGWNLFLSRAGKLQMIHRWDFNNDGYLDLFSGQEDQYREEKSLIYWGSRQGPQSLVPELAHYLPAGKLLEEIRRRDRGVQRLESSGGGRSLVADLDGDGRPDIVLCNQSGLYTEDTDALIYWGGDPNRRTVLPTLEASGVAAGDFNGDGFIDLAFSNEGLLGAGRFGYDKHRESYVYWNGPLGFSAERRTSLASMSARDCAAADLNGDGIADLVILNGNPAEQSLYVYYGSRKGFDAARRERRVVGDALGLMVADLDRDGKPDLVLLGADRQARIFRGFEREPSTVLPTRGATTARVADLNKDGHLDLIIPNEDGPVSFVYWGSAEGFAAKRVTELPTDHASDAAVADFNGDGWPDLVFANRMHGQSFDAPSYLYWNSAAGFHPAVRAELQGFGPKSAQAADFNGDGSPDLLLVSSNSGNTQPCDSFLYWGNARHVYSPASMNTMASGSVQPAPAAADLNQDGWVDFVFPSGLVYWGGADGYSDKRRLDLKAEGAGGGVSVADLNRDGYLDVVIAPGTTGHAKARIYWGGASGYSATGFTELPLSTTNSLSPTIADFNRDGHLDLLFTDIDSDNADFYWGSDAGVYSREHYTHVMWQSTTTVEVADLNRDGWLDLVMGGVYDPEDFGRPMRRLTILWGGAAGYSMKRSTKLEAYESEQQSVADLNKDGYLDIVVSNFHGRTTRAIPVFIYWGSADGTYSETRRSTLPGNSSLDLTLADINGDGWMDIVSFNHMGGADHSVGSNIFWGGPQGFSAERKQPFPTIGPAFGVRVDVGNLYTRKLEETYTSAPVELPHGTTRVTVTRRAETPHGTAVRMEVRTAPSANALRNAAWRDAAQTVAAQQWLQYRAILTSPDGGSTPVLSEVRIEPEVSGVR